ncbi:CHASE2 domain-containing protein [bacterium]|nr:CHASE2 domain-containing protein [bacterium]
MSKNSTKNRIDFRAWIQGALIVIGVAFFAFLISLTDIFEGLGLKLYDKSFLWRGTISIGGSSGVENLQPLRDSPEIVVVAIDQETADSLSFPFNRIYYAQLIGKLNELGARIVVLDIDFSSRSIIPESDSIFYRAIEEAGNVILMGKISMIFHHGLKEPIAEIKHPVKEVAPVDCPWGLANEIIDQDGVTRRYVLYLSLNDKIYLSLGMKIYSLLFGLENEIPGFNSAGELEYGDLVIPRSGPSDYFINYYGPAGTFPTYSFYSVVQGDYDFDDLLAGLSPEEVELLTASGMADILSESPFKDKIVLVGASAEDLQDNKITPFFDYLEVGDTKRERRRTPGVEVHANALQMLIDGSYIKQIDIRWIILAVVIISLLIYLNGRLKRQWLAFLIIICLLVLISGGGIWLFIKQGIWFNEVPLLLVVFIGYPTNLVYRFVLSQREKAMIRGMFSQYVPKKVTDALIANPDLMKLGGERRRMSVLFTDVAGFTAISEKLPPEELVMLLNEYLTAMSQVIADNDGIIDKYEGDLIMAEFGAPLWFEDHAVRCCLAALGMQRLLSEMRRKWKTEGRDELYSRIGINTGEMSVGNMGSKQLFDYTVMGDSVNLSSRLESANKNYNTSIIIGYGTWLDVHESFITRPLDFLRVKGKNEPVEVFELIGEDESDLIQTKSKILEIYNQGIADFRNRQFEDAGKLFEKALEIDSQDGPSKVYYNRCEVLIAQPPAEDWDGAYTLTEK